MMMMLGQGFCGDEPDVNVLSPDAVTISWTFCYRNGKPTL